MLRGALILSACACATRAQDRDMSRICVDSDRAACAKYRENSGSWSASNCLSRIDYQEETGVPQEADRNQWGDFFTTDLIQACTDSCSPACSGQTVQATLEVNGPAKEISTYTGRFGTGDREAWAQVELEAGQRYDFVFPGRKPGPTRFRKEGACGRMRLMLVGPDGGSLAARTTGVPVGNTRSTRNAPIENFLARESGTYYLAACEIAPPSHEHQRVLRALLSVHSPAVGGALQTITRARAKARWTWRCAPRTGPATTAPTCSMTARAALAAASRRRHPLQRGPGARWQATEGTRLSALCALTPMVMARPGRARRPQATSTARTVRRTASPYCPASCAAPT